MIEKIKPRELPCAICTADYSAPMPTFPGFNANFNQDKYPGEVRNALRRIADNFYVTRSFDPEFVGNSQYFAALIRPTDETSVFLNTERELLVVFSRYDTFEIRTLEAYTKFYEVVGSARVDESIRFLVSADQNVERTVKHYLDQHPEYPIIVPVTFDSLDKETNPLIKSVQRNYLIRNLFGFQSPLREDHFFFGRTETVNGTIDFARSGQHSSLFGLRKSGKTSTIFAIQRKSKSSDLNVVVVDCQDVAVHGRTYDNLLIWLVGHVRSSLKLKVYRVDPPSSGPEISEWFSEAMTATLSSLKCNLLLIFDEIENISPGTAASDHWRSGRDAIYFWQVLRSFCQKQTKRSLSICFVGTSPYIIENSKIEGIDNPAYLLATKRFIPNLTFDETREMVNRLGFFMGLNFDAHAVARLHASYGGHPFFTRQVCSQVHQLSGLERPITVSNSRVMEAQSQFASQLENYLKDIVQNLRAAYPEEFRLLAALIDGQQLELAEYMSEAPELVDHLLGYGLIVARDNKYEIAFSAVESAVNSLRRSRQDGLTKEGMWSEICVRRNQVEQGIRSTLFVWSRSLAPEQWLDVLRTALSDHRYSALESSEPHFVLSKGKSPLYLSDLGAFLNDSRVLPYLDVRRTELVSALMKVNGLRHDAHGNDFEESDFKSVIRNLGILEEEFTQP